MSKTGRTFTWLTMALMIVLAGCADSTTDPVAPDTLIVGKVQEVVNPGEDATLDPMADVTVRVAEEGTYDLTDDNGDYRIDIGKGGTWSMSLERGGVSIYTVSYVQTTIGQPTRVDFTLNQYVGWCVMVDGKLHPGTCRGSG